MSDATEESAEAHTPEPAAETAYGCPVSYSRAQRVIHPSPDQWLSVASALLADGFNMCVDVTGVDYLTFGGQRNLPTGVSGERFEVVVGFISHERRERIRARIQVPESDRLAAQPEITPEKSLSIDTEKRFCRSVRRRLFEICSSAGNKIARGLGDHHMMGWPSWYHGKIPRR